MLGQSSTLTQTPLLQAIRATTAFNERAAARRVEGATPFGIRSLICIEQHCDCRVIEELPPVAQGPAWECDEWIWQGWDSVEVKPSSLTTCRSSGCRIPHSGGKRSSEIRSVRGRGGTNACDRLLLLASPRAPARRKQAWPDRWRTMIWRRR